MKPDGLAAAVFRPRPEPTYKPTLHFALHSDTDAHASFSDGLYHECSETIYHA